MRVGGILDPETAFAEFWMLWPYKVNIRQAEITFKKLYAKREIPITLILQIAIKVQKEVGCLRRLPTRDGRDSRPHPSTWLNGKRWLDEVQMPVKEAVGGLTGERRDAETVTPEELQDLDEQARQEFLQRFRGKVKIVTQEVTPPPLKPDPPEDGWEFS